MYSVSHSLQVDRSLSTPIYLQLCNGIMQLILGGQLVPGSRLLSSRKLAEHLGLHRNTVSLAYEELVAQGWVESRARSGMFVAQDLPLLGVEPPLATANLPVPHSRPGERPATGDTYARMRQCRYHFDYGFPDLRLAPMRAFRRHYNGLLRRLNAQRTLIINDHHGQLTLRQQVLQYLQQTRGIQATPDEILITRGSSMAMFLLLFERLQAGDRVAMGIPGYKSLQEVVSTLGAEVVPIAVDEHGMNIDELEEICHNNPPSVVFVIPHHHHPTTVVLSPERRVRLLQLSKQYDFLILEDDYDFEFHYQSSPMLPLRSFPTAAEQVVYAGTFSKTVAPSFRIGYLVASAPLINKLANIRKLIDRTGDPLLEKTVAFLLSEGDIQRALRKALRAYRQRRDLLCQLLEEELGDVVQFTTPPGGMAVWVTFPEDFPLAELRERCFARSLFLCEQRHADHNAIRFGFATMNEEEIRQAFAILQEELRALQWWLDKLSSKEQG